VSCKVDCTAEAEKDLKNLPPDVAQRAILSTNGIREGPLLLLCPITDKSTVGGGMTSNRLENKTNIMRSNGWLI
jgi:hypothetical protein